jgi:hypothetical protein
MRGSDEEEQEYETTTILSMYGRFYKLYTICYWCLVILTSNERKKNVAWVRRDLAFDVLSDDELHLEDEDVTNTTVNKNWIC